MRKTTALCAASLLSNSRKTDTLRRPAVAGFFRVRSRAGAAFALLTCAVLSAQAPRPAAPGAKPSPPRGFSTGPNDQHRVDNAGAERGKKVYAAECITCHGTNATGSERGADLIRSLVVLKDRYGDKIGEFIQNDHPTQVTPAKNLTKEQIGDLAHWLHSRVIGSLRSNQDVGDILTGNVEAGKAFFNGAGGCTKCHSVTGDLARIGRKYNAATLQQRTMFPNSGGFGRRRFGGGAPPKPVMVTVDTGGKSITGTMVHLDDFNVALRDGAGEYHSFKRTAQVKVEKQDPYQFHIDMLPKYTDTQMHDVVAYLESIR
ncbi:MAG: c-type cytochrome [Bryobacteraceae bacterium]